MNDDLYNELAKEIPIDFRYKKTVKQLYYQFLDNFKYYLGDYIKESSIDLTISDMKVDTTPQTLALGEYSGINITLKNQGNNACFLSTDRSGAYRLDPGEKEKFWLNKPTIIVTLSGTTTVGFIRN